MNMSMNMNIKYECAMDARTVYVSPRISFDEEFFGESLKNQSVLSTLENGVEETK